MMEASTIQQKRKNVATCPDSAIVAALAANKKWKDIQAELHVGPGRISRIARGRGKSGSDGGSKSGSGSGSDGAVEALKEGVRELYAAFLKIAENPADSDSILEQIDIQKVDGAVRLT